uniref:Ig-like domain-containing protein n=1 Tax=Phasianus colchicus TaxID=9054 RepID=A0A669PAY3_PHACC
RPYSGSSGATSAPLAAAAACGTRSSGSSRGCRVPGQQHTTRSRCRASDLRHHQAQRREQVSAALHSPTIPVPSVIPLAPLAWDTEGEQLLSPVLKGLSQQFLSSPPTLRDTQSPNPATRPQAPGTRCPEQARVTPAQGAAPSGGAGGGGGGEEAPRAEQNRGWRGQRGTARRGRRSGGMRQCRAAGLAGLAAVLLATVSRAQVQQEPSVETTEGTGINITCSHPSIQTGYYIYWYRQLPGRGPAFLVSTITGSKQVPDPEGQLSVSADRRSSALWLARPRLGDAAVYYCAVGARGAKPGLRPGTNRFGRGGGTVPSGPAGGAACMATKLHPDQGAFP